MIAYPHVMESVYNISDNIISYELPWCSELGS